MDEPVKGEWEEKRSDKEQRYARVYGWPSRSGLLRIGDDDDINGEVDDDDIDDVDGLTSTSLNFSNL